jgi:hypothetical protein
MDRLLNEPEVLKKGLRCPCCDRWAQMYKRHVNATMVRGLARLYRISKARPEKACFHIEDFIDDTRGVCFATLSYWGLVEQQFNDHPDKKTSGYWRITDRGRAFIEGTERIPAYAWVYNDSVHEFAEETCDVHEAIQKKFSYQELMQY